jgi:hypothetical protein
MASLIVIGALRAEVRRRHYSRFAGAPRPGERIVIHSATRAVRRHEVERLLNRLREDPLLIDRLARPFLNKLWLSEGCQGAVFGCGLGTAIIDYAPEIDRGAWAWMMQEVRPWSRPVPAAGSQGFWKWPFEVKEEKLRSA